MQLAAEKPAANNAKRQREISRNNEKLVVVVVVSRERVHETEMKEIFSFSSTSALQQCCASGGAKCAMQAENLIY